LDSLRTPFFILAVVIAVVIVLVELGSLALPATADPAVALDAMCARTTDQDLQDKCNSASARADLLDQMRSAQANNQPNPGLGITYLALIDGLLLFITLLIGFALIIPERVQGRIQGCATLIFCILLILAAIGMIFLALGKVILMVSLLLSAPFGTLAYLAIWGFFDRSGAAVVLGILFVLKLAFAGCLVLAHQRFLQNMGLILLVVASLIGNVVVAFLQGLVPGFLVSITDGIAAIVVAIIAVILLILALIGSIISVVKALKPAV
jgi:hypothetical protein